MDLFSVLALRRWNSFQESRNQRIYCWNQIPGGQNQKAGKPQTDTRKEHREWFRQREHLEREAGGSGHQQQSSWSTTETAGKYWQNIIATSSSLQLPRFMKESCCWKKSAFSIFNSILRSSEAHKKHILYNEMISIFCINLILVIGVSCKSSIIIDNFKVMFYIFLNFAFLQVIYLMIKK